MTELEYLEFFENVRNRKIYNPCCFEPNEYFIPTKYKNKIIFGIKYTNHNTSYPAEYFTASGLEKNEANDYWIYFDKKQCICNVRQLLTDKCDCGYFDEYKLSDTIPF